MDKTSELTALLRDLGQYAPMGYSLGLQIRFTSPEYLFQTFPKAWIEEYSERGYTVRDPALLWAFENSGFSRWSDIDPDGSDDVMQRAAGYGLAYGVTLSVDSDQTRSICAYARGDREFTDEEIEVLADQSRKAHALTNTISGLSDEEREELHAMSVRFIQNRGGEGASPPR